MVDQEMNEDKVPKVMRMCIDEVENAFAIAVAGDSAGVGAAAE